MGKKRYRSSYTSKGSRRNIVNGVREARADRSPLEKEINKLDAWRAGKNPWLTVKSGKQWIRVRANDELGHPKKVLHSGIYSNPKSEA